MNVLIVDDHWIVRRGLRSLLEDIGQQLNVQEANDGLEAIDLVQSGSFDLILLDVMLPDISGLEVLRRLRTLKSGLKILLLSQYSEEQYALRALKLGAHGYLAKDRAPEELVAAIQKVQAGGVYLSPTMVEIITDDEIDLDDVEEHAPLSDREFQVLVELARGARLSELAAKMQLSVKTVSTYRKRILAKLKLTSNAEIVRYAIDKGLV